MENLAAPINIRVCLKIANNNKEIAQKLVSMFIKELPGAKQDINKAFEANDLISLKKHVHKLLGSSAYCGAELIQKDLNDISKHIKDNNQELLKNTIGRLNMNMASVMDYYREITIAWENTDGR